MCRFVEKIKSTNDMRTIRFFFISLLFLFSCHLWAQMPTVPAPPGPEVCQNCDTLILKEGQPALLYITVGQYFPENTPYEREFSFEKNPFRWAYQQDVREFQELKLNFPFVQHVYNNSYIVVENDKHQALNLLNQGVLFKGVLYWSGLSDDEVALIGGDVMLTEKISEAAGLDMMSSYIPTFIADSIFVERMMVGTGFTPSENMKREALNFAVKHLAGRDLEFYDILNLDYTSIKRFVLSLNVEGKKRDIILEFDWTKQQIVYKENDNGKISEAKMLLLKNNLPAREFYMNEESSGSKNEPLSQEIDNSTYYNYKGDTLISYSQAGMSVYKLYDKLFLEVKGFSTNLQDANTNSASVDFYKRKMLQQQKITVTKDGHGGYCSFTEDLFTTHNTYDNKTCYSNTTYSLPYVKKVTYYEGSIGSGEPEGYNNTSMLRISDNEVMMVWESASRKRIYTLKSENNTWKKLIYSNGGHEVEYDIIIE